MDIYLNKEKINYVKSVLNTSLAHEETMEMIVPDALPDILRIVDTDAVVFLRSKSTDNGRVSVSGVVAATILYAPDGEPGIRKMELEIPFTASANEGEITPNTKVTTAVNISSVDASMVNPRKIVARVDLQTDISCYNDDEFLISSGMDDDSDTGIELMSDNVDIYTTTDVKEKTFVISDELNVPSANPPVGEILKYRVSIVPEDTKVVGNKLILRGNANISLLYNPSDDSDITKSDFTTEFSQIVELDAPTNDSSFNIILMMTNAYFDAEQSPHNPDGKMIIMELHAVAQCVASERKQIAFITDLYSTKYKLEQTTADHTFDSQSNLKATAVFHGVMETPSNVSRVIAVNVHTGAVEQTQNANMMMFKCPLSVNALYISDDNRIMSFSRQYEVETNTDLDANTKCTASANSSKDVYGVPVGSGIELRIPIEFNITEINQKQIRTLSNLAYNEEEPLDYSKSPSLVVYRTGKGDTLWNLGKKHNSTAKLIMSANGIENEENVAAGQLLIIPKKR